MKSLRSRLLESNSKILSAFGTRNDPMGLPNWESRAVWKQTHSTAVVEVLCPGEIIGEADAMWTSQSGIPIAVATADCVPILIADRDSRWIAAIHAGWRGTYSKIVEKTLMTLEERFGSQSVRDSVAAIGPCIRACCYEVSQDLLDQFWNEFPILAIQGRVDLKPRHLDLVALNRHQLQRISQIETDYPCTRCKMDDENPDEFAFFSYRRGDRQTRQYSGLIIQ